MEKGNIHKCAEGCSVESREDCREGVRSQFDKGLPEDCLCEWIATMNMMSF